MKKRVLLCVLIFSLSVITYLVINDWLLLTNTTPFVRLRGNYVYVDHDICILDSADNQTLIIPDKVTNYMYDDSFIIAEQEPIFERADYFWRYGREYDKDSVLSLKRQCISIGTCFWIIKLDNGKVYGPLSKDSFDILCKELEVKIILERNNGNKFL